jgi:hypothetical protein
VSSHTVQLALLHPTCATIPRGSEPVKSETSAAVKHLLALLAVYLLSFGILAYLADRHALMPRTGAPSYRIAAVVTMTLICGLGAAVIAKVLPVGLGWPYTLGGIAVFAGGIGIGSMAFQTGTILYGILGPLLTLVGVSRSARRSSGPTRVLMLAGACLVLAWLSASLWLIASGTWYETFLLSSGYMLHGLGRGA